MNKINSPVGHANLSIAVVLFLFFSVLITSCNPKKDPAAPEPSITTLTPESGLPGVAVTITGKNFNTDITKNIVKFGSTAATVSAATATVLTVQAPGTLTVGALKVTVSTSDGNSNEANFTVLAPIVPPQITSFTPDSVSKGQTLTITGANLNDVDSVVINGVKQTIGTKSATTITLNVSPKTFSGKLALYKGGTVTYHTKNVGYKETYTASQFSSYGVANGISIDKSGNIYLATNKAIIKLSSTGTLIDTLVKQDTTNFNDVLARANGEIWVTTSKGGSVLKINNKQLVSVYSLKSYSSIRLAETPHGDVYFVKTGNVTGNDVYSCSSGAAILFATTTSDGPLDIASDPQDNIYVINSTDNKIYKYAPPLTVPIEYASTAIGLGGMDFNPKTGVAYWINTSTKKLYKYMDATHYAGISLNNNTNTPWDLAVTSSGDIVVCNILGTSTLTKIIVD